MTDGNRKGRSVCKKGRGRGQSHQFDPYCLDISERSGRKIKHGGK